MDLRKHMTQRDVDDFLAGKLLVDEEEYECAEPERAAWVDRHLQTCRACQAEVGFFADLYRLPCFVRAQPGMHPLGGVAMMEPLGVRGSGGPPSQVRRPTGLALFAAHASKELQDTVRGLALGGQASETMLGDERHRHARSRIHAYLRGTWDAALYMDHGESWCLLVTAGARGGDLPRMVKELERLQPQAGDSECQRFVDNDSLHPDQGSLHLHVGDAAGNVRTFEWLKDKA